MNSTPAVLALVVSLGALGVAAYGVSTRSSPRGELELRLQQVEAELARLAERAEAEQGTEATLRGVDGGAGTAGRGARSDEPTARVVDGGAAVATASAATEAPTDAIEALVERAVEEKAREVVEDIRLKENKKPAWDVFAATLKLSPEQVADLQDDVRQAQFDLHAILDIPTDDGTNLLDELVEVFARGMARPGQDAGWGRLIGRILSETVPGSDDTYAVRIEALKSSLRETFRRRWSAEQYAEFEAWGVDPTEIQGIPGSPNEALMERIGARARALEAEGPGGR